MNGRADAIVWARKMAADPNVIVVDTETTGIGPDAEIVDLAAIRMDGRTVLDALICPLRRIPSEAIAVHGITERRVHGAPLFREFYPRLAAAFRGKVLCVYNAQFDTGIIRRLCRAERLPDPIGQSECALLRYADFAGEMRTRNIRVGNRWQTVEEPRWWKLSEACERMGVELDGAHRAYADAEATRRLVLAMAAVDDGGEPEAEPAQLAMFR